MNKPLNIFGWLFVIAIVAGVAYWIGGATADTPKPTTVTKVDTHWLPGEVKYLFLPNPTLVSSVQQEIPENAIRDTSCAGVRLQLNNYLRLHYTKNRYIDTFRYDSTAVINDCVVYENKLSSCTQIWLPKFPVVTVHTTEKIQEPKRFKVYLGGAIGLYTDSVTAFQYGPDLLFQNKRENILRTSYRWLSNGRQAAEVGYSFKISLRNKNK